MDYKIVTSPLDSHLQEIKDWLNRENDEYQEGFYCNWNVIEKRYYSDNLLVLTYDDRAIGFLVWEADETDLTVEIVLAEIQREMRHKQLGKFMVDNSIQYFSDLGMKIIKLHCEPVESKGFWIGQGFIDLPSVGYDLPLNSLYRPLIEVCYVQSAKGLNSIELWNSDPARGLPSWIWNIEFKGNSDELTLPIIHPCHGDWNVRWTKNGLVVNENRVKRFSTDKTIYIDHFMYISELTE